MSGEIQSDEKARYFRTPDHYWKVIGERVQSVPVTGGPVNESRHHHALIESEADPVPSSEAAQFFPAVPELSTRVETQTEPSSPKMERGGGALGLKKLTPKSVSTRWAIPGSIGLHTLVEFQGRQVAIITPDIDALRMIFGMLVPGVAFDPEITQQACVVSPKYLVTETMGKGGAL